MSQIDAQMEATAERIQAALGAADLTEFSELLHPDVRWGPPDDPNPGCVNRRQVLSWYRRARARGVRAEVTEFEILGSRILVGTRIRGNDAADTVGGEMDRWQVFTVAAGQIVEIVGYDSRKDALARASASR